MPRIRTRLQANWAPSNQSISTSALLRKYEYFNDSKLSFSFFEFFLYWSNTIDMILRVVSLTEMQCSCVIYANEDLKKINLY